MKRMLIIAITALALVLPLGSSTAAEAQKPTKWKVKAEVNSAKIISGQTVEVTGKVSPEAIGRKVILQKRYKKSSGKWKKVDVARVRADTKFVLTDTPNTARKRFYRVVKPAGDGHRKGVSQVMKVKVEPWDGRVDVKLFWESGADLNLSVYDPEWDEISAARPGPTQSNGEFDAASTNGCGGAGSVEHVSWPDGDAPVGGYSVEVNVADPALCDGVAAPSWRMEIRVNAKLVKTLRGSGYGYASFGEGRTW